MTEFGGPNVDLKIVESLCRELPPAGTPDLWRAKAILHSDAGASYWAAVAGGAELFLFRV